jgi:uncharacterized protein (TIGR02145 family)
MKKKTKFPIFLIIILGVAIFIGGSCKKDNSGAKTKVKPNDSTNKKTITYGSMSDQEGNIYKTLTIDQQTWMAENLKTTKYSDGNVIPNVTDTASWNHLTTGAQCTYKNTTNADTINTYGRLYNWYTVNTNKLCPTGWHVPGESEWTVLEDSLIAYGFNYDSTTTGNKIAKSMASISGWSTYSKIGCVGNDEALNNSTGFTGLPAGGRLGGGNFGDFGVVNYLWSSTEMIETVAICRYLVYDRSDLATFDSYKVNGFSVRCVKN